MADASAQTYGGGLLEGTPIRAGFPGQTDKLATEMETAASAQRVTMEEITALAKRRGFIFQSSEIYGGINGFWDYGPLGAVLKRNVKDAWWRDTVELRDDVVAFDSSIVMHPPGLESIGTRRCLSRRHGGLQGLQASLSRRPPRQPDSMPRLRQHAIPSPSRATST